MGSTVKDVTYMYNTLVNKFGQVQRWADKTTKLHESTVIVHVSQ